MKFTQLKQHLKAEKPHSCYLIYGDDTGVRNLARNRFIGRIESFGELNVSTFEGKADAQEIVNSCEGLPFMSDYRLVMVRDFSGSAKQIEEYLKRPCPSTILVFDCENVGQNLKKIMQSAEVVDCSRLDEEFLTKYVALRVQKEGAKITVNATRLLIQYCNRYLCRLDGEIAKLASETDLIEESLVREKVSPDLEIAVFALTDVISVKDREKTVKYLDKLLVDGHPATMVLGMLYNHFRKLFYVSVNKTSDTLSSDLGVKEYTLKYAFMQAAKFTPKVLKAVCDIIAESDYAFKSGRMTDKNALYSCVLRILNI